MNLNEKTKKLILKTIEDWYEKNVHNNKYVKTIFYYLFKNDVKFEEGDDEIIMDIIDKYINNFISYHIENLLDFFVENTHNLGYLEDVVKKGYIDLNPRNYSIYGHLASGIYLLIQNNFYKYLEELNNYLEKINVSIDIR